MNMRSHLNICRTLLLIVFLLSITALAQAQGPPELIKVEPPNWWAGSSINPVRVLLRGRNLMGAQITVRGAELRVANVRANAAGTYLFADVWIAPNAAPGVRGLHVTTPKGLVDAAFEVSAPLPRAGRFQGWTTDDVVYLIMTDRFSDGDP